ncbi:diguanylate cyclase [Thaumasiovibrio sp. DFM-14]|uniref:sensor domain-containing diguanylate cyclase n=1 Tax=Thaumasiovibrio sp. DFM-14 TaxID=3384792 RepID=UPI0039A3D9E0
MNCFKSVLDGHPNPCVVHIDFVPVYANDAFAEFSGLHCAKDVLTLSSLKELIVQTHWQEAERRYQLVLNNEVNSEPQIIEHTDLNGMSKLAEITDTAVMWEGQKAVCTYISVVTDSVKRETALKEIAMCDELTDIANRRYLSELLNNPEQHFSDSCHYLVLIDLDHFKQINDSHGHLVGDELLVAVAQALHHQVDSEFKACRIGGEEFAVILRADDAEDLVRQVDCVQTVIAQTSIKVRKGQQLVSCTASAGVSAYKIGDSFNTWFERSDKLLYKAKGQGRNVVVYEDAQLAAHVAC